MDFNGTEPSQSEGNEIRDDGQLESSKDAGRRAEVREGEGFDAGDYEPERSPYSNNGDHDNQDEEEDVFRADPEEVDSDGEPISTSTKQKGKQPIRRNNESQMDEDVSPTSGEEEVDSDGESPSTSTEQKGVAPRQQPGKKLQFL